MADDNPLDKRRQALEESFFQKQNAQLIAAIREKKARQQLIDELGKAMSLNDEALLGQLVDTGLRSQTWLAISLVPLIEVAWADREMEPAEREAVLKAAAEAGTADGSEVRDVLNSWLDERPGPSLREVWKSYIATVLIALGDTERELLQEMTLGSAREVAKAAGGILGFGNKISDVEEEVLKDLEAAFQ
ncbi:MAG: hypothetical protein ACI8W3_000904 [Myxococcota bacterium]|jgi:hypothetical protein